MWKKNGFTWRHNLPKLTDDDSLISKPVTIKSHLIADRKAKKLDVLTTEYHAALHNHFM